MVNKVAPEWVSIRTLRSSPVSIIPSMLPYTFVLYQRPYVYRIDQNSRYHNAGAHRHFLGTLAKLQRATITFPMPVRLSVLPHGTTRHTGRILWNLTSEYFFENLSGKNSNFIKSLTTITGNIRQDLRRFMIIYRWILRMRAVSDESCTENQNINSMFNPSPPPPQTPTFMW